MRKLLPLLVLLSLLAAPAAANATDEVVESGTTRATFSYTCTQAAECSGLRVRLERFGIVVRDEAVTVRGADRLVPGRSGQKSIELRQLDSDAEPEVLLDVFTGGANCCLVSFIYDLRSNGGYARIGRRWNRAGYVLRNIDHTGRIEFDSADPRFDGLYASTAETPLPVQIFRFQGGRLRAVTRVFKNTVRRDRDEMLRIYRQIRRADGDVRGALAAYQADNYLLSRRTAARGWRVLRGLQMRGIVSRAYLRSLQRKLRQFGYAR